MGRYIDILYIFVQFWLIRLRESTSFPKIEFFSKAPAFIKMSRSFVTQYFLDKQLSRQILTFFLNIWGYRSTPQLGCIPQNFEIVILVCLNIFMANRLWSVVRFSQFIMVKLPFCLSLSSMVKCYAYGFVDFVCLYWNA